MLFHSKHCHLKDGMLVVVHPVCSSITSPVAGRPVSLLTLMDTGPLIWKSSSWNKVVSRLGNPPKLNNADLKSYGWELELSWKGLDFSVFLQGVLKRDFWLDGPYFWGASGGMWQSTCFTEHLDYWRPDNPDAYYPRPNFSSTMNQQKQTGYLQNAAYVRIKNVQVGYPYSENIRSYGIKREHVWINTSVRLK